MLHIYHPPNLSLAPMTSKVTHSAPLLRPTDSVESKLTINSAEQCNLSVNVGMAELACAVSSMLKSKNINLPGCLF